MTPSTEELVRLSPAEKRELLAKLLQEQRGQGQATLPLSYGQQALWFMHHLAPESSAYNETLAVAIHSAVNVPVLRHVFQRIVDRHPIFRTTYTVRQGVPVQTVHPEQTADFAVLDVCHLISDELSARLWAEAEVPFNLERGPVFRARLFVRGPREYVLLMVIHHIAIDGWSFCLLLEELRKLYEAETSGLAEPPLDTQAQYTDYVRWQQQMLAGSEGQRLGSYWQRLLARPLPALNLMTDRPRPPVQTYRGQTQQFALDHGLSQRLYDLARGEETTVYCVLLAALQVLLHRYTGQTDLLIGSPVAGRNQHEFAEVIGYFANPLVLRADLAGQPTFRQLLERVRTTVIEALKHQDYPFALLVEQLVLQRDPSRSPLIDVMFVLQKQSLGGHRHQDQGGTAGHPSDLGRMQIDLGRLEAELFHLDQQIVKFDLELEMIETGEQIAGWWKHNIDLFDAATVARLSEHFQALLAGIVAAPDTTIDRLPLLSPAEHRHLVSRPAPEAGHANPQGIHQLFEAQAAAHPHSVALTLPASLVPGAERAAEQLTYQELNGRANQLAHYLRSLGVGRESVVGIFMERSIEMVVAILATLKAGAAYLPIDPAYPQDRVRFMLTDARVPVLLTHSPTAERLGLQDVRVVDLNRERERIAQQSAENCCGGLPASLAYVIYTSGSTGRPKGVQLTHANVTRLLSATDHWYHFTREDVWTLFHSYAFDFSVWELWGALCYGGRLVVVPYWVSRSPDACYDLLAEQRVTVLNQTPSAFRQLMAVEDAAGRRRPLALRYIIFGGEALEPLSLRPWFARHGDRVPQLVNMYGITETTVHVTYRPIGLADLGGAASSVIGCAIPDLQVYILDGLLQPVPVGVPGEMYVGGDGVARGYLGRPDLTAERFIPNPFGERLETGGVRLVDSEPQASRLTPHASRLYKTGDLARWLPDGDIEFLGRADHQVKIRGFRIEIGEIEAVLHQHPAIREAFVMVREDSPGDRQLVAYVVGSLVQEGGGAPPAAELREFLKQRLPDYMVPSALIALERLPLTSNGKIDRQALPAIGMARPELAAEYVTPQNDLERSIAAVWQRVLRLDRVGRHDNFFDLGGNSLALVTVQSQIQDVLHLTIPMIDLFQHPTVGLFADHLQRLSQQPAPDQRGADRGELRSQALRRRRNPNV